MKGKLNVEILKKSLDKVIKHYDIFKFRFDINSGTQSTANSEEWQLNLNDISTEKRPWKKLDEYLLAIGKTPFNLLKECPARFYLYHVVEETAVFAMVCHHIALDGWSIAQFVEDISKTYSAFEKNENFQLEKRLRYQDFVLNPLRFGDKDKEVKAKSYWEEKFKDKNVSHYPFSPNPSQALEGSRFVFSIEYDAYKEAKDLAKKNKTTPFIYLLSAFYQTLMEKMYQENLCIGIPAGNRNSTGADKMLGQCSNLLPFILKADKGVDPEAILKMIKAEMINCFQFMIHPYEELEHYVGKPLFNISFNMEPATDLPDFGEVSLFIHPFPISVSEFDLTINITDLDYYYHCEMDFRSDVLNTQQVLKLSQEFVEVLKKVNQHFKVKA
jgi:NRPS condensation-like uncharacterized protein